MAALDGDVAVVGGGPAGSTAAAFLARAGRGVLVLERDEFPRFHIGESLLASVNDVLDTIGAADLVWAAGFPEKWGAFNATPHPRMFRSLGSVFAGRWRPSPPDGRVGRRLLSRSRDASATWRSSRASSPVRTARSARRRRHGSRARPDTRPPERGDP